MRAEGLARANNCPHTSGNENHRAGWAECKSELQEELQIKLLPPFENARPSLCDCHGRGKHSMLHRKQEKILYVRLYSSLVRSMAFQVR